MEAAVLTSDILSLGSGFVACSGMHSEPVKLLEQLGDLQEQPEEVAVVELLALVFVVRVETLSILVILVGELAAVAVDSAAVTEKGLARIQEILVD